MNLGFESGNGNPDDNWKELGDSDNNDDDDDVYDYDDYDDDGDDGDDGDDEQGKLRGRQSIMAWYEWSRGSLRPVAIFFQIGIVMMTKLVIIVMMILVNDEWCGGCWCYSSLKAFNCYWN